MRIRAGKRSQVKRIFADENYLKHWAGDLDPRHQCVAGPARRVGLVVCGESVRTMAGQATANTRRMGNGCRREPGVNGRHQGRGVSTRHPSLVFHCCRLAVLPAVNSGPANFWAQRDLHGLVWEWVSDFNSATVTGDARGDTGLDRQLFCGAFRLVRKMWETSPPSCAMVFVAASRPEYSVHNLGFRCAKDL